MAHVRTDASRLAQTHQRVEVGAVQIDLAPPFVDHAADVGDGFLEHAVGGRIGDHQRAETVAGPVRLGAQVVQVDVALVVAVHHHHGHARQHRAGGIGAVGGAGNEADVALPVSVGGVILPDHQQPRVLALGAGVGLHRHRGEPGDGGQPRLQCRDQPPVAQRLVGRREGVHPRELGPRHRNHLGGGVELHGAGTQRDHRLHQAQVLGLKLRHVTQHAGLGVVLVEHLRFQEVAPAEVALGQPRGRLRRRFPLLHRNPEHLQQLPHIVTAGGLVHRDVQLTAGRAAEIDAALRRRPLDLVGPAGVNAHPEGVEKAPGRQREAAVSEAVRQMGGAAVDPRRDVPETRGAVVDGVHGGHHRQQHLRRADIAGGLLPADMLLAGLQGKAQRPLPVGIPGDPHQTAGDHALVALPGGEKAGVRAAETHGHAEALGAADDDVRAHFPRRLEQAQAQQVGGDDAEDSVFPAMADEPLDVRNRPAGGGVLDERGKGVGRRFGPVGAGDDLNAQRRGAGAHHLQGLRKGILANEQLAPSLLLHVEGQKHRFGGCGPLVEQGGIGNIHGRELHDHGLEIQQGFQAALGDLRLIGRVGGVPARVLEDVPEDDGRGMAVIVAHADVGPRRPVGGGDLPGFAQQLLLGQRLRQLQLTREPDAFGHRPLHQLFQGTQAQRGQHLPDLRRAGADVPRRKQLPKRTPSICLVHDLVLKRFSRRRPAGPRSIPRTPPRS